MSPIKSAQLKFTYCGDIGPYTHIYAYGNSYTFPFLFSNIEIQ